MKPNGPLNVSIIPVSIPVKTTEKTETKTTHRKIVIGPAVVDDNSPLVFSLTHSSLTK